MSGDQRLPHWIALDGAVNARAVVPGVLLRADNLQSLTARDVRLLVEEEALEVVLDLRTDVEVALEGPGPMTAQPAVRIEHRSLFPDSGGNTDLDADTIKPWEGSDAEEWPDEPPLVRAYMSYLRRPDSIVGSLRAIARADGAVLVHCAAGKDRTGVVVALALDAAAVDRTTIAADYLATGERIEAIMRRLVSSPTYRTELEGHDAQAHAPVPGTMERVLELIDERFGGSAAWLSAHGLSDADRRRLRDRLAPAGGASRRTEAKHVLLLRHAKSSWDDPALADHDRPLAARGRRAAQAMGAHLRRERIRTSLVLCSSARRARETLDLVAPAGDVQIEPGLYGASAHELLERLRHLADETDTVMLIGHNPAIQDLAVGLDRDPGELAVGKFPTGALAILTFTGPWRALAPGHAALAAFVRPRELR